MADDPDLRDDENPDDPVPPAEPQRKRRRSSPGRKPTSRFQKRADKAAETVRELVRLRRPDLDVTDQTFSEVVDRDHKAWGEFLAQIGEWIPPVGLLIDLVFGAALVRVLKMAPSFRAAQRDLRARRERRQAEREQEQDDDDPENPIAPAPPAGATHLREAGAVE